MDNLQDNSKRDESSSARRVQVKSAPGIYLTPEQVALLNQAFPKEEIILVKQEFRSGYSGAVVVLVSVGVGRAPLVVKLAHPHDLQKEYEAYEEYVRQVSPQNIAHLQGKPLVAPDGQLGLLQYTFAGGESHLPTTSMQEYFESAGAEATSAVLNRIFRVYGRHWWANNRAQTYVLDEYYDRMLPVHLQASRTDAASQAEHVIQSGESGILAVEKIAIGQVVELAGYQVIKVRDGGRRLTLMGQSPASEASAPLRVRVELDKPAAYHPGDTVESMVVTVTATRQSLLGAAAHAALPSFDPQAKQFTLSSGSTGGDVVLPNPLLKLPQQLYQVVETKTSIIHGDLNLQNVLVDGPTGFAWLIDFAETRVGPTLLDLQRLEVQAITKLLPAGGDIPLAAVVEMMTRLHADPPLPAPPQPQLREPYALLATIRRLARQYLIDDLDWNEYYYGLVVVLLGALKYDELDSASRRLALVCAAAAESLIGQPLQQVSAIAGDMAEQDEPNPPAPVRAMAPTPRPDTPSPVADTPPRATPALPLTQKPARPVQQRAAAPAVVAVPSAPAKKARNTAGLVIALVALLLIGAGGWWISTLSSSSGPSTAAELASGAVVEAAAVDATDAPSSEPTSATPSSDLTAGADLAGAAALAETPGDADAQTVQTPSATTEAGQADRSTAEELVAPTAAPSTPATEAAQALPTATQLQPSSTTAVADAVEAKAALTLLSSINMRSGPGSDYPIVGTLRIGTVVEPVGRGGNSSDVWYQIEDPEKQGQLVWVSGNAQLVDASGVANVPQVTPVAGVTPIAAATQPPALSARSGQIYFSAPSASGNDNIYSVPATGDGAPILVVSNARQPAHVANGTRLAFKSTVDSALGISGYDEATQNRVVYSGSPEDAVPSWNPGGDQIVFGSNRAGDRNWRLYVTWPNSGGTVAERGKGADPDWHPSQDLVVFKSCDDSGGRCGLWTMAADGSNRRPLTNNPSDSRPRWTPDGSSVVFMSAERDGNWELYQVQAAGGDVRRLTDNPANDGLPAVSPDGEYVAFLSNRDGAWGIWSVPLAGGDPELVAALNTPMPDWLSQGLSWSR